MHWQTVALPLASPAKPFKFPLLCAVTQLCLILCDPIDYGPSGSSVHRGQEHWSGLPCPSQRPPLNPGIKPTSPALHVDSSLSEPP